jgi:hypothetical protein
VASGLHASDLIADGDDNICRCNCIARGDNACNEVNQLVGIFLNKIIVLIWSDGNADRFEVIPGRIQTSREPLSCEPGIVRQWLGKSEELLSVRPEIRLSDRI